MPYQKNNQHYFENRMSLFPVIYVYMMTQWKVHPNQANIYFYSSVSKLSKITGQSHVSSLFAGLVFHQKHLGFRNYNQSSYLVCFKSTFSIFEEKAGYTVKFGNLQRIYSKCEQVRQYNLSDKFQGKGGKGEKK